MCVCVCVCVCNIFVHCYEGAMNSKEFLLAPMGHSLSFFLAMLFLILEMFNKGLIKIECPISFNQIIIFFILWTPEVLI